MERGLLFGGSARGNASIPQANKETEVDMEGVQELKRAAQALALRDKKTRGIAGRTVGATRARRAADVVLVPA